MLNNEHYQPEYQTRLWSQHVFISWLSTNFSANVATDWIRDRPVALKWTVF